MRKITLIIIAFLTVTSSIVYASKPNVNRAKNKIFVTETTPDVKGAKAIIDEAIQHEETKNLAKTWYVAAEVYLEAARIATGENVDITIGQDVLKAYEFLQKAYELDLLPNKKGKIKPKYGKKIASTFVENIYQRPYLINYGVTESNSKNYTAALNAFNKYTEVLDLPMLVDYKDCPAKDSTYYDIRFYAAQCAWWGDMNQEAIKIYESIKDKNIKSGNEILQSLSILYKEEKDTANYIRTLNEGIEKYSNEFYFLGSLINFYVVETGRPEMGKEFIEKAIQKDPNNPNYYIILSRVLLEVKDTEGAMQNIDKALAIDAENHDAWNTKGALVYYKAAELETKAGEERDYKKADALTASANIIYKESIPYFEKAVKFNPDNLEYLVNLRRLYYRFMDDDPKYMKQYEELDEIIKSKQ